MGTYRNGIICFLYLSIYSPLLYFIYCLLLLSIQIQYHPLSYSVNITFFILFPYIFHITELTIVFKR